MVPSPQFLTLSCKYLSRREPKERPNPNADRKMTLGGRVPMQRALMPPAGTFTGVVPAIYFLKRSRRACEGTGAGREAERASSFASENTLKNTVCYKKEQTCEKRHIKFLQKSNGARCSGPRNEWRIRPRLGGFIQKLYQGTPQRFHASVATRGGGYLPLICPAGAGCSMWANFGLPFSLPQMCLFCIRLQNRAAVLPELTSDTMLMILRVVP